MHNYTNHPTFRMIVCPFSSVISYTWRCPTIQLTVAVDAYARNIRAFAREALSKALQQLQY